MNRVFVYGTLKRGQRIEITTDFGDAWMYIVKAELCQGKKLIPGDWRFNR